MMRRFGANTDKRRLAVTLGLLLLAAVLLFAAEAVLDNLHGRPSGEPERITADALILSGAKAEGDGFSLSGAGSAAFDVTPADIGNVTFSISATEDRRRETVVDLIDEKQRKDLFPVGRLDIDTEGLLLITNDGALAHRLLAPGHHVDKVYEARCEGLVPDEAVQKFRDGMELSDGLSCMPAELEILERKAGDPETGTEAESLVSLTLHEGKFHQVKRMMEEVGCPVVHLKRLSMGPLKLDATLKPGEYRKLTDKERELLENL